MSALPQMMSSASNEWCTPTPLVTRIVSMLGHIYLSSHRKPETVRMLARHLGLEVARVGELCCSLAEQGRATCDGHYWRLGPPGCSRCRSCDRKGARR